MGTLHIPGDTGLVSDGYHMYNELYNHRDLLFCMCINLTQHSTFKSRKNSDGSVWEGMFVAGIELPSGLITYHLSESLWMYCNAIEIPIGKWDNHTSNDVIDRLKTELCKYPYTSNEDKRI